MKIKIIIGTLLFVFPFVLKSKDLDDTYTFSKEAVYNFRFIPDSTDLSNSTEVLMSLLWGEDGSLSQPQNRYYLDSTIFENYKIGKNISAKSFGTISVLPAVNYQIYKIGGKIFTKEAISGAEIRFTNEFWIYEDNVEEFDWSIKEDTATISEMFCQKAELDFGGRKWTAWFAPEIPIMEGPYKFQGLPGLIVSITDEQGYFKFDLISLLDVDKTVHSSIRKDEVLKKTTKDEFLSQRKYLRENMYSVARSMGLPPNEKLKENARKFAAQDNNHIEKY